MLKQGDIVRGLRSGDIYHIDAVTAHHVCYTRLRSVGRGRNTPHGTVPARYWLVTKIGQNYKEKT